MLALYPDEEVERASRCHGHQQKVIASRHEFDTCPVTSTRRTRFEPLPSWMVSVRAFLLSWTQPRALVRWILAPASSRG